MDWTHSRLVNTPWTKLSKLLLGESVVLPQLTFTCLKSTIETLEKDKKYVQR